MGYGGTVDQQRQRQRLEALRTHLVRRGDAIERDLRSGLPADFEEQGIALENDEVLMRLARDGRPQLALIEQALARMDEGAYGRCVSCGEAIPASRLEALPHAAACVRCASRVENEAKS